MKSVVRLGLLMAIISTLGMAYAGPRENADVMKRAMDSSGGSWFARFGHVALYDKSHNRTLEVTVATPAIVQKHTNTMTNGHHYEGARYGVGSTSQHYRAIRYGLYQRHFNPHYTLSPYCREGKWTYGWSWSWWHWRWTKKWYKKSAKFRCDSFVNYCYKKVQADTWSSGCGRQRPVVCLTPCRIADNLADQVYQSGIHICTGFRFCLTGR